MHGSFLRAVARAEQARLDRLERADARAEQAHLDRLERAEARAKRAAERADQARKDALAVQQAQLEQGDHLLALLEDTIMRSKLSASENA